MKRRDPYSLKALAALPPARTGYVTVDESKGYLCEAEEILADCEDLRDIMTAAMEKLGARERRLRRFSRLVKRFCLIAGAWGVTAILALVILLSAIVSLLGVLR